MLLRLVLRDVVIVAELEIDLRGGFTVLTGETGAGKSILIDALQLALGSRGEAALVREGCARAEILAEFEPSVELGPWLEAAGFDTGETLLLKRSIDAQGRSRAWINGGGATLAQLRELGERLVDIHGQHAWQSLVRPEAVRGLLDAYAGADAAPVAAAWEAWRDAKLQLEVARQRQGELERERERLQWQLAELDKLAPGEDEWASLNAEHQRLAHAQGIQEAVAVALEAVRDAEASAEVLTARAVDALERVVAHDPALASVIEVLQGAQAQLQDAGHSLHGAAREAEQDPARLEALDARLGLWVSLARRWRRPPEDLHALGQDWRRELQALDAATDLAALEQQVQAGLKALTQAAATLSRERQRAAPKLSAAITAAMQDLGMAGGRFEVLLQPQDELQRHGRETVEFLVAGHPGSSPRPLAKVASGGELSRVSLAIAVSTSRLGSAGTLIFDEIDAGVGGAVAETVGRLMQQLGRDRQVLAVTHLPQVAACADHHLVVTKQTRAGRTLSGLEAVAGEARITEIARMLGGQQLSGAGLAHAKEMLQRPASAPSPDPAAPGTPRARKRSGTP